MKNYKKNIKKIQTNNLPNIQKITTPHTNPTHPKNTQKHSPLTEQHPTQHTNNKNVVKMGKQPNNTPQNTRKIGYRIFVVVNDSEKFVF